MEDAARMRLPQIIAPAGYQDPPGRLPSSLSHPTPPSAVPLLSTPSPFLAPSTPPVPESEASQANDACSPQQHEFWSFLRLEQLEFLATLKQEQQEFWATSEQEQQKFLANLWLTVPLPLSCSGLNIHLIHLQPTPTTPTTPAAMPGPPPPSSTVAKTSLPPLSSTVALPPCQTPAANLLPAIQFRLAAWPYRLFSSYLPLFKDCHLQKHPWMF